MPIKKVLIPSDFSDRSTQAIESALPTIKQLGAEVVFVHVLEYLDHPDDMSALFDKGYAYLTNRSQTLLNDLVMAAKAQGLPARGELLEGTPYVEIVHYAEKIHADLILMASHGKSGFNRLILGSQTEKVVRMASCPVTTIKVKPAS